jgi:hypothetical protein
VQNYNSFLEWQKVLWSFYGCAVSMANAVSKLIALTTKTVAEYNYETIVQEQAHWCQLLRKS